MEHSADSPSSTEANTDRPILELRNVSKNHDKRGTTLNVLRDVSLKVPAGAFVSLVGPSGCGKSSILRLVTGLDTAYDGEVLVNGKPVHGPGRDRAIVFQDHRLLPWLTVKENVDLAIPPEVRTERHAITQAAIDLVGLGGFASARPHELSGGMAQRASIARALAARPKILLLDEPLGALDALSRGRLQAELLAIWEREAITSLLVTHDVEEAIFLSTHVAILTPRPGRVRRVVEIDLPRPRDRLSPAFIDLREEILSELHAM